MSINEIAGHDGTPAVIQIEVRRGTAMKRTRPIKAAADCAAWMRELLR